jgi:glutamine synthetase
MYSFERAHLELDAKKALEDLQSLDVEWIDLQFVDLIGYLRHVTLHKSKIDEKVFLDGLGKLDGSSVKGFRSIEESDLVLKPLPHTLAKIPESWFEGHRIARYLCEIYEPGGENRLPKDPRYALERTISKLKDEGYEALMSFELEFFVFDHIDLELTSYTHLFSIESAEITGEHQLQAKEAYYVVPPSDTTMSYCLKLSEILREYFRVPVEVFHHEVARGGQIEINYKFSDPITASDRLITIKYAARNVARTMDKVAVFLPKVLPDDNGNGLHAHISIWRGETNLFFDENDQYANLSQLARYFIGGLLDHARALAAFTNPTVNSYRRLVPGYEAPIYLVWSKSNRSAAVRIPFYHPGDPKTSRIEYRPPDPTANPYLASAAILLAGLDGIKKKKDPGDPIDENVYRMTPERRRQLKIKSLPRSLEEALDELESDMNWLIPTMPKDLIETYIELKREEARRLAFYPSVAEIKMYLNL